jgi:hypothetical protein
VKRLRRLAVVAALGSTFTVLGLPSVSVASDGAEVVPQRFCQIGLDGGLVLDGEGITVITPSGGRTVVCRAVVPAGLESTVVQLTGEPKGNILVMTTSGRVIVVFTPCGPSEPTDVCG